MSGRTASHRVVIVAALGLVAAVGAAVARAEANERETSDVEARGPFTFAVIGAAGSPNERVTATLLQAAGGGTTRFVVQFELAYASRHTCSDVALARRRSGLDASTKPVVPVLAGAEWAACGAVGSDERERLEHADDLLFGTDEALGQRRMPWLRQSAIPRFKRYRENLRWASGRVVFATLNLPDANNGFWPGAGRNGEFEDRLVANRAWIERTFRFAAERQAVGVVLFFDAAPRFDLPVRAPDVRSAERDGYYEIKAALREHATAFKGQILLVQGRPAPSVVLATNPDRPLKDAGGRPLANVRRIVVADDEAATRWLRITVDPTDPAVFRIGVEHLFDDPSGELYGAPRLK